MLEFDVPAAAVIKHTNPCGVAIGATISDAYVRAREADRLSAFGGIVALNREIDRAAAQAITATKIDCVVARAVADEAREILRRKPNMRVVIADCRAATAAALELRSILGAMLVQERDAVVEARAVWTRRRATGRVSRGQPQAADGRGVGGIAIRLAGVRPCQIQRRGVREREQTLAIGAGQMSRVDAVKVAMMMARRTQGLVGSVAATDGFFPFRDGVDLVATAGATAVIHPGGRSATRR